MKILIIRFEYDNRSKLFIVIAINVHYLLHRQN